MNHFREILEVQRRIEPEWGFRSLDDAIRSWVATVALVESGFNDDLEEYALQLHMRDYLAFLCANVSEPARKLIVSELEAWDSRFKAATVEASEPVLPASFGETGWWQRRVPEVRPAGWDCELSDNQPPP